MVDNTELISFNSTVNALATERSSTRSASSCSLISALLRFIRLDVWIRMNESATAAAYMGRKEIARHHSKVISFLGVPLESVISWPIKQLSGQFYGRNKQFSKRQEFYFKINIQNSTEKARDFTHNLIDKVFAGSIVMSSVMWNTRRVFLTTVKFQLTGSRNP